MYKEIFGDSYPLLKSSFSFLITPEHVILGDVLLTRENSSADAEKSLIVDKPNANLILRRQLFALRSLALCIQMNWFVILVSNVFYLVFRMLKKKKQSVKLVKHRLVTVEVERLA